MTSYQRLPRLAAGALLVLNATGCHTMRPVYTAVEPGETPRAIGSASVSLREGPPRMLDSIVVRADSLVAFDPALRRRVAFAHDEVTRIERWQIHAGRSIGLAVGMVALAGLAFLALIIGVAYSEAT